MKRAEIDPQWAWAPFEPDARQAWNVRLAAHLFRRAAFGAAWRELDAAVQQSPSDVVRRLLDGPDNSDSFQQASDRLADTILATGDPKQLSAWWVYGMLRTPHPLLEKMTLFWHGHFATSGQKVEDAASLLAQNRLLRSCALGDFAALVQAVARDPAMLTYLDSATNRKAHPNENFARELMELFCLGEGNYTERDVQELARCFTGWEIRRGKFRFNRYQHDSGDKQILGLRGPFPEGTAIDLVLQQPPAARFIVGKLFRFLVCDEPAASEALLEPLVQLLRERDWDIRAVVGRILGSNLFFSEHAMGRKIRAPVDLAVGLLRCLDGSANAHALARDLFEIGQGLFYPPNVKGWDGGRAWINSSTLLGRANMVGRLLRDESTRFGGGDLVSYFASQGAEGGASVVDRCLQLMLAVELPAESRRRLIEMVEHAPGGPQQRVAGMIHALGTLPEFQLA